MLPLLAAVYDIAHQGDGPFENAMEAAIICVLLVAFMKAVMALGIIAVKRYAPSEMIFAPDGVYYSPPPSGLGSPGLPPDFGYFGHGNLHFLRRNIRDIRFTPDAVTVSGPPFLGFIPMHMRIPDCSHELRARITSWAEQQEVDVINACPSGTES